MPSFTRINIHLRRPYLAKYLIFYSQRSEQNSSSRKAMQRGDVYFDRNNPMGKWLCHMLKKGEASNVSGSRSGAKVTLCFSDKHYKGFDSRYSAACLSKADAESIDLLLGELFAQQLYYYVKTHRANGVKQKQAIEDFLQIFDIREEEMRFETAKKQFQRQKEIYEDLDIKGLKKIHQASFPKNV